MPNRKKEWLKGLTHLLFGAGSGATAGYYMGEASEAYSHAYRNNPEDMPIEGYIFRYSGVPSTAAGVGAGAIASGAPGAILRKKYPAADVVTARSRRYLPYLAATLFASSAPAAWHAATMKRVGNEPEGDVTGIKFNVNMLPDNNNALRNKSKQIVDEAMEAAGIPSVDGTSPTVGQHDTGVNDVHVVGSNPPGPVNTINQESTATATKPTAITKPTVATATETDKQEGQPNPPASGPKQVQNKPVAPVDGGDTTQRKTDQQDTGKIDKKQESSSAGFISPSLLTALLIFGLPATAGLMSLLPSRHASDIDDDEEEDEDINELKRRKRRKSTKMSRDLSSRDLVDDCIVELVNRSSRYRDV